MRKIWKTHRLFTVSAMLGMLALILTGLILGLVGCDSSSGDGDDLTGVADAAKCAELEPQCEACEEAIVESDPACAEVVDCTDTDDFWECLYNRFGYDTPCERAIDLGCYDLDSVCDRAWEACADTPCDAAYHQCWKCEMSVILYTSSCADAQACFWYDGDPWDCIENILGEDSQCEHDYYQMCVKDGTACDASWKTCFPNNYACAKTAFATCTAWLMEQDTCTAEDKELIAACAATNDLYSEACWKQDSGISDACWDTLISRDDCQFDTCDRQVGLN
jgi:hypothetical protein